MRAASVVLRRTGADERVVFHPLQDRHRGAAALPVQPTGPGTPWHACGRSACGNPARTAARHAAGIADARIQRADPGQRADDVVVGVVPAVSRKLGRVADGDAHHGLRAAPIDVQQAVRIAFRPGAAHALHHLLDDLPLHIAHPHRVTDAAGAPVLLAGHSFAKELTLERLGHGAGIHMPGRDAARGELDVQRIEQLRLIAEHQEIALDVVRVVMPGRLARIWEGRRRHQFALVLRHKTAQPSYICKNNGETMKKAADLYRPQFELKAFRCPHCLVVAQMKWAPLLAVDGDIRAGSDFLQAVCTSCNKQSLWLRKWTSVGNAKLPDGGLMAWPTNTVQAPSAHPDLPSDCEGDFEEARQVGAVSPRASAALLRLCVQKLCVHLGCPGKNINDDIAALVKRGLSVQIKQALDVVRVVGNNAVHPGEMSPEDTSQVVDSLFGLVNFIVEQMITQPNEIDRLHSQLPAGALQAIERRDNAPKP